jgi:hypothetical protein
MVAVRKAEKMEGEEVLLGEGKDLGAKMREAEEFIEKFDVSLPTDMICPEENPISRMCINALCTKQALICHRSDCKSCGDTVHPTCHYLTLDGLVKLFKKKQGGGV